MLLTSIALAYKEFPKSHLIIHVFLCLHFLEQGRT